MNSRSAIGVEALMLKQDHGFALGVREMSVFFKAPHDYAKRRNHDLLKITPDLVLGQAFHKLLLCDDALDRLKVCLEAESARGVKTVTGFNRDEITLLSPVDMWRLEHMLENFWQNEDIQKLFNNTLVYKNCGGIFIEQASGCECFFNADFMLPGKRLLVDVKTSRDVSPGALKEEIERFHYNWQAWWAGTGASLSFERAFDDFLFIFVGQKPPFEVIIYFVSPQTLRQTQAELRPFIDMYGRLFEAGRFC